MHGNPSIASALAAWPPVIASLLLPMYPQYAASTTATACDAVFQADAGPIDAGAAHSPQAGTTIQPTSRRWRPCQWFWKQHGRPDKLDRELSRRPKIHFDQGVWIHTTAFAKTARLLARELGFD